MNWDTRRGSALIIAMIMSIIIISLSSSAIFMAVNEQTYTYGQSNKLKSRYIAEAGLAEGVKCVETQYLLTNYLNFSEIDILLNPANVSEAERAQKIVNIKGKDYLRVLKVISGETQSYVESKSFQSGKYTIGSRLGNDISAMSGDDTTGNMITSCRYILLTSVGQFPETGTN